MDTLDLVLNGQRYTCTLAEKPAEPVWSFPVGNGQYPPEMWYAATLHDPTGALNNGYKHTGIDLNLDQTPYGDIERRLGLSVYAIADGLVTWVSQDWYGVPMIVVRHEHDAEPLWVRYAHIIPVVLRDQPVKSGQALGSFADWRTGDHLHFDMTRTAYTTAWFTPGMMDPVDVLKMHLDPARVDAMMKKG